MAFTLPVQHCCIIVLLRCQQLTADVNGPLSSVLNANLNNDGLAWFDEFTAVNAEPDGHVEVVSVHCLCSFIGGSVY